MLMRETDLFSCSRSWVLSISHSQALSPRYSVVLKLEFSQKEVKEDVSQVLPKLVGAVLHGGPSVEAPAQFGVVLASLGVSSI